MIRALERDVRLNKLDLRRFKLFETLRVESRVCILTDCGVPPFCVIAQRPAILRRLSVSGIRIRLEGHCPFCDVPSLPELVARLAWLTGATNVMAEDVACFWRRAGSRLPATSRHVRGIAHV